MRIGFFDSGIGGISILNEVMKYFPREDFLYYADTLNVPYGTKTKEEVNQHVKAAVENILKEDVKALIIACNTATSISINELRSAYDIPIIGMEPAAKPAIKLSNLMQKKVLVFATDLTLKEVKYRDLIAKIDKHSIVDSLPLPELVEFCEELNFNWNTLNTYFKTKLQDFDLSTYCTVVLGCTHFPYYKPILKELLPSHIQLVDGSKGTIKRLSILLKDNNLLNENGTNDILFKCSDQSNAYIEKMKDALSALENELNKPKRKHLK
ncbi:glutamate racemase [Priestia megaterium]|jgi:glutamate racemase|uniref:glutamate racemase n=1 Tax=Priestia megaterium TaxID=1404 RepID=UPI0028618448|nr:glutamate racemase [Priestia megaterium]MDR7240920.1 glutamate racemase [Priestia megaterium]